jgi:AraC-like DNA-binding protein
MPRSAHFNFADPIPYQTAIRAAEIDILVSTPGEFRAELTQIDFSRLWMQVGRERLPRVFHSAVSSKRAPIVFLLDADQQAMHHSGVVVSAGEVIVDGLGATHHHRSWGPCRWGSVSLTPEDLITAGRALADRDLAVPSVTHIVRPSPPLVSRLLTLHEIAERLAKNTPEILLHAEVARALENSLVHAMIACLTATTPVRLNSGARHHSAIVERFEEFLAANLDRPLYLAEICAAIGASERTLRVSCQEHVGMGPVRYLWLRRMHLSRRALMLATSESATVTEIAMNYGFWEPGRFSVAYRRLFGESPSTTLHRRPVDVLTSRDGPFSLSDSEFA